MRWTIISTLLLAACRNAPAPCVSDAACGAGMECLANHCALEGSDPVAPESIRFVLSPSASALVSARRPSANVGLPVTASFGSRVEGAVAWYLDFTPNWPRSSTIDRAFLVLTPDPGLPLASTDVQLDAWRVSETWQVSTLEWNEQPDRAPPRATGIATASPPQLARIDVTSIVRYWQQHPHHRYGLAVESRGGTDAGVGFATGAGGASGPELEVYVIEEKP